MSDITWFGHSAFKISNQDVHVVIDPFLAPQYGFSVDDVGRADLVLLTHDHADQTHGIDDIRAFFIRQAGKIDCHMDEATAATSAPRLSAAGGADGAGAAATGAGSGVARAGVGTASVSARLAFPRMRAEICISTTSEATKRNTSPMPRIMMIVAWVKFSIQLIIEFPL